MSLLRPAAALCLGLVAAAPAAAQETDIDALVAAIDRRSGQYDRLIEILQGTDATRALAAFDVMTGSDDPTLVEVATTAALGATDSRLRARALWEVLARKTSLTLEVETDDLDPDARAALDEWIGAQSAWGLFKTFPETQCINLIARNDCYRDRHLSVSGLQVDMVFAGTVSGRFRLDPEGRLAGRIAHPGTATTYPASIDLR